MPGRTQVYFRFIIIIIIAALFSVVYFSYNVYNSNTPPYTLGIFSTTTSYFLPSYSVYNTNKLPAEDLYSSAVALTKANNSCDFYLVCSPSCHIPDVDPWHESILPFIKRLDPVVCSDLPPLTRIEGRTIQVVQDLVHSYTKDNSGQLHCCCYDVTRQQTEDDDKKIDDKFALSECLPFQSTLTLNEAQEFLLVKCNNSHNKEIYANIHVTVPTKHIVEEKMKNNTTEERKMSVLLFGIDAISQLNFIRQMPKTVEFLRETGWVELQGYNKMDDNTFPNVMAILTGMNYSVVTETCFQTRKTFLDDCPLIWKNFSEKNYITCYAEDEAWMATFNYAKVGFHKPPTDYYLRPIMAAAPKHTKVKIYEHLEACYGPTVTADRLYEYCIEFTQKFLNEKYFALFWMNSMSHNDVNRPASLDERSAHFLERLEDNGVLNNTFIVFLSDHGMRFGKIRETYVGWLEERLPFIYIWVPEWYREQYPEKYTNLLNNRNKLTSPFDLYLTLNEILESVNQTESRSCPKCLSLFDNIPDDRSCADVGVTERWCTCSQQVELPVNSSVATALATFTLNHVNQLLDNNKDKITGKHFCSELRLKNVTSVRRKSDSRVKYYEYTINFEALPSDAAFEATIRDEDGFALLGTVSRINAYGSQSACITEARLKLYCYCQKTT